MGKPVCARASRSDSRRRGSTSIETATKAPSRPDSEGLTGNVLGQTLIDSSSIRRRGPAENKKPWSPKAPGSKCYRTDRLAFSTFFSVVAISQARKALNQSTSISDYHYGGGEATGLMIGSNTSGGDYEAVHSVGGRTATRRCFRPSAASPAHQPEGG